MTAAQNAQTPAKRERSKPEKLARSALLAGASGAVLFYTAPLASGVEIHLAPAAALIGLAAGAAPLAAEALRVVADMFADRKAKTPTGLKGTAGWASASSVKADLAKGAGPYWGAVGGKPIIADYASNALTVGPAGSGKGVGIMQPTILSIRADKVVVDFKGEHACVLSDALRVRGERVIHLNLGEMWEERLGPSDSYNPLNLIADNFWRPGGLQDVSGDIHDMSLQLYPEPASNGEGGGGKDDNRYFRDGSRTLIGFGAQAGVLVSGYEATLGDVQQMLNDRESLLQHALWIAGRLEQDDGTIAEIPLDQSPWAARQDPADLANYRVYLRGLAASVANLMSGGDTRTFESFLTGAQQALARFDLTTRAHKRLRKSSFRFADLKEGPPTTVFLIADASRIESQKDALGLVQWCMAQELKRAENKHRPVYVLADECTNFQISGLESLLTWGRGYGVRLHLVVQSLSAFRRVYGREALNTLLSETEVKQFLAGQREPETLKLIEEMLGARSVVGETHRRDGEREFFGVDGTNLAEETRALMTGDEVRRADKAILIIRRNKALLTDLPPVAAIHPYRDQIAVNPFHGKPFRLPVRLRMGRRSA